MAKAKVFDDDEEKEIRRLAREMAAKMFDDLWRELEKLRKRVDKLDGEGPELLEG